MRELFFWPKVLTAVAKFLACQHVPVPIMLAYHAESYDASSASPQCSHDDDSDWTHSSVSEVHARASYRTWLSPATRRGCLWPSLGLRAWSSTASKRAETQPGPGAWRIEPAGAPVPPVDRVRCVPER